jgi:hypothetical protein
MEYIYIIRRREHVRLKEPIYKIGMTSKQGLKRLLQYDGAIGLEIYGAMIVSKAIKAEIQLKEVFNEKFDLVTDLTGSTESYRGSIQDMLKEFYMVANQFRGEPSIDDMLDHLYLINPKFMGYDEEGFYINEPEDPEFMTDNILYVAKRRLLGYGETILEPISDISIQDPYSFEEALELLKEQVTRDNFSSVVLGLNIDVELDIPNERLKAYINRAREIYKHII